ncbi:062L [Invertebrate iridescent virus Kaz2018]|nr:062L [Invertebrate iridescent virus Kaz2018]
MKKNMILFFGILKKLLICILKMPIKWWLTSDIVYFDSELALTVKQFFMQKNNTILDKIVSHCYGLIMQKISQPVIFKNYIYIWRAILFADCTIKTNKTHNTQNIINLSQNATEEVKIIIDELIDCFKNKNNFKEEEYKPNLDLLNAYIKNIKKFITENKTSKFIFDKDWEILINNIWMN